MTDETDGPTSPFLQGLRVALFHDTKSGARDWEFNQSAVATRYETVTIGGVSRQQKVVTIVIPESTGG